MKEAIETRRDMDLAKLLKQLARSVVSASPSALLNQIKNLRRVREDVKRRQIAQDRFASFMRERLGRETVALTSAPFPPRKLLLKTQASDETSFQRKFELGSYEARYAASGYRNIVDWFLLAERQGMELVDQCAIFELGVGTGPMLRHLIGVMGTRHVASDVNPEMVDWCREHLPGATVHVNSLDPPLSFTQGEEFDLMYCHSVFTHIPLDRQAAWIREIARILKSGGWAIVTVAGRRHADRFLNQAEKDQLYRDGQIEIGSQATNASLSTSVGGSLWDVYQTRDEVRARFAACFEIKDYAETANQDVLILRKP